MPISSPRQIIIHFDLPGQSNNDGDRKPHQVLLSGSFDDWHSRQPMAPHPTRDTLYHLPVAIPSTHTRIQFKFIVDGVWMTCARYAMESDGVGNVNNALDVVSGKRIGFADSATELCELAGTEKEHVVADHEREQNTSLSEGLRLEPGDGDARLTRGPPHSSAEDRGSGMDAPVGPHDPTTTRTRLQNELNRSVEPTVSHRSHPPATVSTRPRKSSSLSHSLTVLGTMLHMLLDLLCLSLGRKRP